MDPVPCDVAAWGLAGRQVTGPLRGSTSRHSRPQRTLPVELRALWGAACLHKHPSRPGDAGPIESLSSPSRATSTHPPTLSIPLHSTSSHLHPSIVVGTPSSVPLPPSLPFGSPSAKQLRQHQLHGLGSCRSAGRTQYSQWYAFVNLKVLRIRGLSLSLHQRQAEQSANHRHRRSPSRAPSSPTRVRPKPPTAPSMIATAAVAVAAATSTRGAAGRACARLASLSGPSSQLPPSSS